MGNLMPHTSRCRPFPCGMLDDQLLLIATALDDQMSLVDLLESAGGQVIEREPALLDIDPARFEATSGMDVPQRLGNRGPAVLLGRTRRGPDRDGPLRDWDVFVRPPKRHRVSDRMYPS